MTAPRKLRAAMVGGGRDAFIGAVHRHAMALDGGWALVAGALSSTPEKARASGADLGLANDRNHGTWQALLADELRRPPHERIDAVVIVTPNDLHYPVALAFVEAGFHVVCDKPLVHTVAQAEALAAAVAKAGTVFGVTYNYSGYPMVREARSLVRSGVLGELRKVIVEYHQGWLATGLQSKQADWRTDPARSGAAGAVGDIGTHAEHLLSTVTGLRIESLCAELSRFVPGRRLDDDASMLLRLEGGVRGVLLCSQIEAGCENDIRLRVYGSRGHIEWRQEEPNVLVHAPIDGPKRVLTRNAPWLSEAAKAACRLPAGHPEAFIEAFANVYRGVGEDILVKGTNLVAGPETAGDYPRIDEGVRGVKFIKGAVDSGGDWIALL